MLTVPGGGTTTDCESNSALTLFFCFREEIRVEFSSVDGEQRSSALSTDLLLRRGVPRALEGPAMGATVREEPGIVDVRLKEPRPNI